MDTETSRIPARSRRQAMDWSLVLVSQGIETTIDNSPDGSGWGLIVPAPNLGQAVESLRKYHLENRGWPWQQRVLRPGFLFDWVSLAWVALLVIFFVLNSHTDLEGAGLMNSTYVAHGHWWRLFTAMWLHADAGHLAANAVIGSILLGLTMGRYGTGTGLLAAYLAGAGGNVAAWLLSLEQHRNLGASGMVMGCLGLLATQSLSLWRSHPPARKYLITSIGAGVMLFILFGMTPGTDVMAHLGGFISGLSIGWFLLLVPKFSHRPSVNFVAAILFTLLVLLPWYLAVKHAPPPV